MQVAKGVVPELATIPILDPSGLNEMEPPLFPYWRSGLLKSMSDVFGYTLFQVMDI
jgi:hypothetical protein